MISLFWAKCLFTLRIFVFFFCNIKLKLETNITKSYVDKEKYPCIYASKICYLLIDFY